MSVVVEKLRRICENTSEPLGFRMVREKPTQRMLLIAVLAKSDVGLSDEVAASGVDAVLARGHEFEKKELALGQLAEAVGQTPWGLWLDVGTLPFVERVSKEGADFVVCEASVTPVGLLQDEGLGKILKLELPRDETVAGAVNGLDMDAVLLEVRRESGVLTVLELLSCQWLSGSVGKPLLVSIQDDVTDVEVQALWDAGVRGLIVEAKERKSQENLARLRGLIESLPARPKRADKSRAILPSLGYVESDYEDD